MKPPSPSRVPLGLCLVAVLSMVFSGCQRSSPEPRTEDESPARVVPLEGSELKISGPYRHENLTLFLIHGKDTTGEEFITLDEGLKSGAVILSERGAAGDGESPGARQQGAATGSLGEILQLNDFCGESIVESGGATVNTLTVENRGDRPVYIQAGDIVKGGQQDRSIGVDIVIAPKSGKVPLAAFCVEQGRWSNRSTDVALAGKFLENEYALNSKSLKLAVRHSADQSRVWENVAKLQADLSMNVRTTVNDTSSPTSLQLTLENDQLKETVDAYLEKLEGVVAGRDDVIGYAFAINGRLNSADVYASNGLFRQLWTKLLHASATEAIAELGGEKAEATCTVADIVSCVRDAERGEASAKDLDNGVKNVSRESDENLLFETRLGDVSLRKNYLTK